MPSGPIAGSEENITKISTTDKISKMLHAHHVVPQSHFAHSTYGPVYMNPWNKKGMKL